MALPLKDIDQINERLSIVEYFVYDYELCDVLRNKFEMLGDLERLISKAAAGRINPRELVQLKRALFLTEEIMQEASKSENAALKATAAKLNICVPLRDRLEKEIKEDAPVVVNKGNVIGDGVNAELDELRAISGSGKGFLLQIQNRESERTGIPSLKVAFNNVFGYYLEVTNSHKDKVPADWIRKQTLTNAERYITPELKTYEEKILGAEEKISAIEVRLYEELVRDMADYILPIQQNASLIARMDCLLSFAALARNNNYVKPQLNDSFALKITDGRHPVIEKQLPLGEEYVSNSVYLDNDTQQIIMITGPNMSGKSAL